VGVMSPFPSLSRGEGKPFIPPAMLGAFWHILIKMGPSRDDGRSSGLSDRFVIYFLCWIWEQFQHCDLRVAIESYRVNGPTNAFGNKDLGASK